MGYGELHILVSSDIIIITVYNEVMHMRYEKLVFIVFIEKTFLNTW